MFAGPLANFLLSIFIFSLIFLILLILKQLHCYKKC
jgi:membrane-associated protease RseP (regulator of RpoE activity)